ncbi:methyltransferase [Amycolatopsis sp. QT-25]|uniref:methyltransferase n=1 Tax=Amycolatopsis sp. QT-25 TaxID=3034022 RepID=UPI0023ECFC5B|nr:methyltransferase [Amycolatopsis sp. QT-25]WET81653.1 methyltransferase [Amycolatopsis sp. QT-25]
MAVGHQAPAGPGPLSMDDLTPILFGHAAFQYLNAGCRLGLFRLLHETPDVPKKQIGIDLGLDERATDVLLLGTTSLRLTSVRNDTYRNASVLNDLFVSGQWEAFTSVVDFESDIVYESQADFVESLRHNTNVGLRRIRGVGRDLYQRLAENPPLERTFYRYMRSWSEWSQPLLLEAVDFGEVGTLLDVGGGDAVNAIALARAYPRMNITVLEIPATESIARQRIRDSGLDDRITVRAGDMFADPFPGDMDCVLFAHQLVIWNAEQNVRLLRNAHQALRPDGRVVIFSSMSGDAGDGPLMAALDSVYFAALPAEGGMIYSWSQYRQWLATAGFGEAATASGDRWTPHGLLVAGKRSTGGVDV